MNKSKTRTKHHGLRLVAAAAGLILAAAVLPAAADRSAVLDKPAPETLADLQEIQRRVEAVAASAGPATVALMVGEDSTGSGVVVTEDGYVLTAAHVIGEPGQLIEARFPDGRVVNARTLGSDRQNDAGMVKLEGDGPWPFVEMADGQSLQHGDWVVALGHPGGFEIERSVVVRLGRVIRIRKIVGIQSDCSLIGGDSGGPLLDLEGRVVGIHSRIGRRSRVNIHVAVGDYANAWQRLAAGEQWIRRPHLLGVWLTPDEQDRGAKVVRVMRDSPAKKAGLKPGDIIVNVNDQPLRDDGAIHRYLEAQGPGDTITLTVLRNNQELHLKAQLPKDQEDQE